MLDAANLWAFQRTGSFRTVGLPWTPSGGFSLDRWEADEVGVRKPTFPIRRLARGRPRGAAGAILGHGEPQATLSGYGDAHRPI